MGELPPESCDDLPLSRPHRTVSYKRLAAQFRTKKCRGLVRQTAPRVRLLRVGGALHPGRLPLRTAQDVDRDALPLGQIQHAGAGERIATTLPVLTVPTAAR